MFYAWINFDLCQPCSSYAGYHADSYTICDPSIQYLRKIGPAGRDLMTSAMTSAKLSDQHKLLSAYQAYVDEGVTISVYLQDGHKGKTRIEHGKTVKDERPGQPAKVYRFVVTFPEAWD
jgi:hypothetical protein